MTSGQMLLMLLGSLLVFVLGVAQYHRGWVQRAEAEERSRLARGESTSSRLQSALDARIRRSRWGRPLETWLASSGMEVGLSSFVGLLVLAFLGGTAAGVWLLGLRLGVLGGVAGVFGLRQYVEALRSRRREQFVQQLPELVRVMSNASSAGLSLPRAIELATAEVGDPSATVMQRVVDELRLGQSVEGALDNLRSRLPSREVSVLVSTLVIQQRAGGDTVRALREMADTLEARKDLRREVRAILSGPLTTGYLLGTIAAGFVLFINVIFPGVLDDMLSRLPGQIALALSVILFTLAVLAMRRITRIET